MIKNKEELTNIANLWLKQFLVKNYSDKYNIITEICETSISKNPRDEIKRYKNYACFNFQPDVIGILEDKKTKEIELILLNRSFSSISLREIGTLYCYAKLANAKMSILFSAKGAANEVNLMLLNKKKEKKLLNYLGDRSLQLVQIKSSGAELSDNFFFPINSDFKQEFLSIKLD